jgi:hypothetical protein
MSDNELFFSLLKEGLAWRGTAWPGVAWRGEARRVGIYMDRRRSGYMLQLHNYDLIRKR